MKTADFKYKLPKNLIAKYPILDRSTCRLLLLNSKTGRIIHCLFLDIVEKLIPGDLIIFNDTRVIPARLYGRTVTGKKIEILIERILNNNQALAYIWPSELVTLNIHIILEEDSEVSVYVMKLYNKGYNKLFRIYFNTNKYYNILTMLNYIGHIPLPPYLKRLDESIDYELYQTIYGFNLGSIAASTAGLHFDAILMNTLLNIGIEIAFVTLHVGSATFQPVRVNMVQQHIMHDEYIKVSQKTIKAILCCKKRGNKVIAVGTTVAKSLETASIYAKNNLFIESFEGYSRLFIYPGYQFRIVDALITNFHLSESTLLMLVAAFAGYKNTFRAYNEAICLQYKFLSYGDAMCIMNDI